MDVKISSKDFSAELHRQIDRLFELESVDGFIFSLAVFHKSGVRSAQFGKGPVSDEELIRTQLRMLIDHCRTLGSPNALAMIKPLECCVKCIEKLYWANESREAAGHA